jgi:hypothetical protein
MKDTYSLAQNGYTCANYLTARKDIILVKDISSVPNPTIASYSYPSP